nr:DUF4012 domain-containing protein [Microbacterium sp. Marseille-Q6965]
MRRVAGAFGLALVAALAWLGVRAVLAAGEAVALVDTAGRLEATATAPTLDLGAVREEAAQLASHAEALAGHTADPLWRAAELVPGIGPTLAAVRVTAGAVDHVAARGVTPTAAAAADVVAALRLDGERVDVGATDELAVALTAARRSVDVARDDLARLDMTGVVGPAARLVERVDTALSAAQPVLSSVEPAARLLAAFLGDGEPRRILLMVQNPAELRAAGGLTGTFLSLEASDGRIELVDHADGAAFPVVDAPAIPLPPDTRAARRRGASCKTSR